MHPVGSVRQHAMAPLIPRFILHENRGQSRKSTKLADLFCGEIGKKKVVPPTTHGGTLPQPLDGSCRPFSACLVDLSLPTNRR